MRYPLRRPLALLSALLIAGLATGCGSIDVHEANPRDVGTTSTTDVAAGTDAGAQSPCEFGDDDACDDGDSCTRDQCTAAGTCVNTPLTDVCLIDGECYPAGSVSSVTVCKLCDRAADPKGWTDLDCDDGDPCTDDKCDGASGCFHLDADGAPCDDGLTCTDDEACAGGACVGSPCECDGTDASCAGKISVGTCERVACVDGACAALNDPAREGASCSSGALCVSGETCASGVCQGGEPVACTPSGPCLDSACDPVSGACVETAAAVGAACDPSDACVLNAACDEAGDCAGEWDMVNCGCTVNGECDDALACTLDTCDAGKCASAANTGWCVIGGVCVADGEVDPDDACARCMADLDPAAWTTPPCDDGDACTAGDTCQADGSCLGTAMDCDDALACTADDCIGGACSHELDGTACLIDGACVGDGQANPDEPCQVCDVASGSGGWTVPPCDDGDACTVGDICGAGGQCQGEAKDCSGLDQACQVGLCDATGNCQAAVTEGAACDDVNPCTTGDVCDAGGACAGTWDGSVPGCGCDGGSVSGTQSVCAGDTPALLASVADAAGGVSAPTYQWESRPPGGTWTAIAGATSSSHQPLVLAATTELRRRATSDCGTALSNVVTVTVYGALVPGAIAADQTVCAAATPAPLTSTAPASAGSGAYAYQWQQQPGCLGGWADISGASGSAYTPGAAAGTLCLRRRVTDACGAAATNVVQIDVAPALSGGIIAGDQAVCPGAAAAPLTSAAAASGGVGTTSYTWQAQAGCGGAWTAVAGATGLSYTPVATAGTTTCFRREASNACGAAPSNAVTVVAGTSLSPGSIGGAQTVCAGDTPSPVTSTAAASGGTGSVTYQWQRQPGCSGAFTNISGAAGLSYSPPTLSQTTCYRRQATDGCGSTVSGVVTVTVLASCSGCWAHDAPNYTADCNGATATANDALLPSGCRFTSEWRDCGGYYEWLTTSVYECVNATWVSYSYSGVDCKSGSVYEKQTWSDSCGNTTGKVIQPCGE